MKDPEQMTKHELVQTIYKLSGINGELLEALEKITQVSQFGRDGGPIVMSEHYEAAWLDCSEIAEQALAKYKELK
jgi:hypothetical protein